MTIILCICPFQYFYPHLCSLIFCPLIIIKIEFHPTAIKQIIQLFAYISMQKQSSNIKRRDASIVYNSYMNHQKKLISIFRSFVEKIFLPHVRSVQGVLQDWSRFSALLANESINFPQLQGYVDSLPPPLPHALQDRKQMPLHVRKWEEAPTNSDHPEQAFHLSKTFGGERAKNIVIGIRQLENSEPRRQIAKEHSQGKEYIVGRDESFRKPVNSMPNIGSPTHHSFNSGGVGQALERVFKQLVENQQKIEAFQSKIH